jgi:hypothetical protein
VFDHTVPGGRLHDIERQTRQALTGALAGAGLEVQDARPYPGFRHRVDQATVRDIVVARAP